MPLAMQPILLAIQLMYNNMITPLEHKLLFQLLRVLDGFYC